jgi:hypothetical protein
MAEQKVLGILIAIGLVLVAGIFAFFEQDKAAPDESVSTTVAVDPAAEDAKTTGALPPPKDQAGDKLSEAPWSGKILVSKRPVQVLAAPTSSASAMYGFPAGRPFRAIGRTGGFVRIQDVRSGASGWIEEAALEPAPTKPAARAPSTRKKPVTSAKTKPKAKPSNKKTAETVAPADDEPQPTQRKRRGLFGGGGLFGGLFGGRQ